LKKSLIATAALMLMAAPAMAQMAPSAPAGALSSTDKHFIEKAAQGGIAEVQLAQLAQQKGESDTVKQFAQKMIDDHTPNNQQLVALATKLGDVPPTEPNAMQQKMMTHLQGLEGAKFDRAYITGQIKAHTAMLKLFQEEAKAGENEQVKAFAEQTVPVIQQHLSMAEADKSGAKSTM
jgi:putative membrane protein